MWVLFFLWYHGSHGLYYAGNYNTQQQCEAMAHRIDVITLNTAGERRDISLNYICVEKPGPEVK